MAVVVNTNVQSLVAQRNLSSASNSLSKATERLSTGLRINKAADDAAGLFIAKGLEAQVSGSKQCQNNISLAINVLQIAEGDLTTIQDNVLRIKDLATQAASGIYSTEGRTAIGNEIKARINEINRVAKSSNFNGISLLTGEGSMADGLRLQVGPGSESETNSITIEDVFTDATADAFGLLADGTGDTDTEVATAIEGHIATPTASAAFIANCETALNKLSEKRAKIGVEQNRLEMASNGLAVSIENLSSAKSTIMDTDIASTTSDYTNAQILQQISTSMLTQANQQPQIALSLLG